MERLFAFINEKRAVTFAQYSLALMMVWFGFMNFSEVGEGIVTQWLEGHIFLSGFAEHGDKPANILGVFQILFGIGLVIPRGKVPFASAIGAAVLALGSLTVLLFAPVWVDSLGGFPAIGAGQGLIKYFSILGVALFLAAHFHRDPKSAKAVKMKLFSNLLMVFGIILVLAWIGGMKFTEVEANGIEPLLRTSPFFSWLLEIFDKRGASDFIGFVEISTALLLLGWFFNRTLFMAGATLCVITFLGTLSFLITLPGWQETLGGFPALSSSGHFLLKDLVMLAATFLLVAEMKAKGRGV